MLNKFLSDLVGPKCLSIKVEDPLSLSFNPRELLRELITVYIHLGEREEFLRAVVEDSRSFSMDLFER
jgi:ubiquitin conjugation factor E4 B